MSKFSSVSGIVNNIVMDWMGDPALFRPKGFAAFQISVVFDRRDVEVFDGGTNAVVETQQLWFWLRDCDFNGHNPRNGDEIVFERKSYELVQIQQEQDGGVWVRVHEAEKSYGTF
jgi:hypothetical protein